MNIYDISVPISENLPVWPGDPKPVLSQLSSIKDGDHSNVSQIRMSVHTGTHIDAPRHFIDSGNTIEQIPLDKMVGEIFVMAIPEDVQVISEKVLINHPQIEMLNRTRKVLFRTKNSSLWYKPSPTFQNDYVGLDASGASFLADLNLDLVGVDYLSIASFQDTKKPHHILLEKDILLLEGINLFDVPEGQYTLYCLPLLISGCEGSPARAILFQ